MGPWRAALHRARELRPWVLRGCHTELRAATSFSTDALPGQEGGRPCSVLVTPLSQGQGSLASAALWVHSHKPEDVAAAASAGLEAVTSELHSTSLVCVTMSGSHSASTHAVRAMQESLKQNDTAAGTEHGVALAGCTAVPWHPHSSAYANRNSDGQPGVGQVVHVTVTAAHLPGYEAHPFHTLQGAVPPIPHLPEALTTRPPQVVLLGCDEQETYDLRRRFEGLFGEDSVLADVTSAVTLPPKRVGLLTSPGTPGLHMFTTPVSLSHTPVTTPTETASGFATHQSVTGVTSAEASVTDEKASISSTHLRSQAMVYAGGSVHTEGCVGFLLMPKAPVHAPGAARARAAPPPLLATQAHPPHALAQPPDAAPGPSPVPPAAPLTPESGMALVRALLGWPRFQSMRLSEPLLSQLQPPRTAVGPPRPDIDTRGWVIVPRQWCCPSAPIWQPVRAAPAGAAQAARAAGLPACAEDAWARAAPAGSAAASAMEARVLWPPPDARDAVTELILRPPGGTLAPQSLPLPTHFIPQLPFFMMSARFGPGTGGSTVLRIFEPRYQWLVRKAVEQGGAWGFTLGTGLGVMAALKRYFLNGDQFYCEVDIGPRFVYRPDLAVALPGTFGLVASDVQLVEDYELGPLASDKERRELVKTALEVVAMLQPLITQHQVRTTLESRSAAEDARSAEYLTSMLTVQQKAEATLPDDLKQPNRKKRVEVSMFTNTPSSDTTHTQNKNINKSQSNKPPAPTKQQQQPTNILGQPLEGLIRTPNDPSMQVRVTKGGKRGGKGERGKGGGRAAAAARAPLLTDGALAAQVRAAVALSHALAHRASDNESPLQAEWMQCFSAHARLRSIHKHLQRYTQVTNRVVESIYDTIKELQTENQLPESQSKTDKPASGLISTRHIEGQSSTGTNDKAASGQQVSSAEGANLWSGERFLCGLFTLQAS